MVLTFPMIASIAVVILVVVFQLMKFRQNRKRIDLFSNIFAGQDYELNYDNNDMVVGILGSGNQIWVKIKLMVKKPLSIALLFLRNLGKNGKNFFVENLH